jgi:hypothetical protein
MNDEDLYVFAGLTAAYTSYMASKEPHYQLNKSNTEIDFLITIGLSLCCSHLANKSPGPKIDQLD